MQKRNGGRPTEGSPFGTAKRGYFIVAWIQLAQSFAQLFRQKVEIMQLFGAKNQYMH